MKVPSVPVARLVSSGWLSQETIAPATGWVVPSSWTKPRILRPAPRAAIGLSTTTSRTTGGRSFVSKAQPAPR